MLRLHEILYQQTTTMQYLEISIITTLENYVVCAIQELNHKQIIQ